MIRRTEESTEHDNSFRRTNRISLRIKGYYLTESLICNPITRTRIFYFDAALNDYARSHLCFRVLMLLFRFALPAHSKTKYCRKRYSDKSRAFVARCKENGYLSESRARARAGRNQLASLKSHNSFPETVSYTKKKKYVFNLNLFNVRQ